MTKPTALLVPISEHNVAQLYNCLSVEPDAVVLMASAHFFTQRQRFLHVLQCERPTLRFIELELPKDAENYAELVRFARQHLQPLSQHYSLELNCSGGTKVIPLSFIDTLLIQRLYYKGLQHNQLQSWQPGDPDSFCELPLSTAVNAEMALALYAAKTEKADLGENHFKQKATALTMAEVIWQQYTQADSPMSWLATALSDKGWCSNRHIDEVLQLEIPTVFRQNSEWLHWFELLTDFSEQQIWLEHQCVFLRSCGKKKHLANQFNRWLSGDWLEQLVQNWLVEHIPENQLLAGIKPSGSGLQGDLRELDFICFHHTAGYVIETKVTTEPGQSANKMVQQLASLAEHFGKLKKILLLSPLFFQRKTDQNALDQFKKYCQGHDVVLCQDKASLLSFFNRNRQD